MLCTAAPRLRGRIPPQSWLKKTTQLIVERGNDYVIAVKGNQPKLFQLLQTTTAEAQPAEQFTDVEKSRNRVTCRIVSVFDRISKVDSDWSGINRLVQVDRIGIRVWATLSTN